MKIHKEVSVKINDEYFYIKQNEFWYFINMLKKVSNYFKQDNHQSNDILIKIPGTGEYRKINYIMFNNLKNQLEQIFQQYKLELQN